MLAVPLGPTLESVPEHICQKFFYERNDKDWPLFAYHLLYMHRFPNLANDGPLRAAAELVAFNQEAGRLPAGVAPDLLASMALGVVLQAAHGKLLGANIEALSDHIDMFERAVMAVLEDA